MGRESSLLFSTKVSSKLIVTGVKLSFPNVDKTSLYSVLFNDTLLKNYLKTSLY